MSQDAFTVLYRWRIREGSEKKFVDAWTEITDHYVKNAGSVGSRLHRGSDGVWYAYAQWPSAEARDRAFLGSELTGAKAAMREAIEERFPEVVLSIVSDRLG